jgi:hypothetical protein
MVIERSENRRWYEGPLFPYKAGKANPGHFLLARHANHPTA